jgi:hypothetical protein
MSDSFTLEQLAAAREALAEYDATTDWRYDGKLHCYEWEAARLLASGLVTADEITVIPTLLPKS